MNKDQELIKELVSLLKQSANLGLSFSIGNAYIRRSYIDKQEELINKIKQAIEKSNIS